MSNLLDAPDQVLSTLNKDGSRRWLNPRLSPGRFLTWRRAVAYLLLIVYNALPWISINGKPSILLNIPDREFTFFGATFLPTDTLLLMLFIAGVFVTIFLITALFGRVWCGWACPQTVYMEFVFRPIERLFLGATPTARRKNASTMPIRRAGMYLFFFLFAFHLAHTFLAYFVGPQTVFQWSLGSPMAHPLAFMLVLFVTGLILLDFGFFREQICIVCCPYGRLQSVMLDKDSMIVSYDRTRGEPRGKQRRKMDDDVPLPQLGDCIDCRMCVTTCPTGIDIREGLQMECIGCAQCIDACDAVMDKIDRPRGLIRYSSQNAMERGRTGLIRPRVILYPALLLIIAGLFIATLVGKQDADLTLIRATNRPFTVLASGMVKSGLNVKIVNRADEVRTYSIQIEGIEGALIEVPDDPISLDPGEMRTVTTSILVPGDAFTNGRATIDVIVEDNATFKARRTWKLQGPWTTGTISSTGTREMKENTV